MTTAITSWDSDILTKIPLLPHPALLKAVRDAAIDFCENTLSWKEWLTAIDIAALDRDYAFTLPVGPAVYGQIDSVRKVLFKENGLANEYFGDLAPTTEEEMDYLIGAGWQFQTAASPSKYLVDEDDPTTILLYPIPTNVSTGGLLVQVYCKPIETASVLPTYLYSRYRKAIRNGALTRLFGETAMPWSNPQLHAYYADLFANDCDNAMVRAVKGGVQKDASVQFRGNWI